MKITNIEKEAARINSTHILADDPIAKLTLYAGLIILCLKFAKIFVGEKADAKLDEVIKFLSEL